MSEPSSFVLSFGSHSNAEGEKFCLLEACSLPPELVRLTARQRRARVRELGLSVTDHPPDVCDVRAAFGRSLNDSYGNGAEADAERTEDCAPLEQALRGTKARGDSERVALFLWDRALHE
ncbi:MAG TPA: hypothetical protein VFV10_15910, partial [Gammaproteobacteria bacterium]|nr:hypothetical protein [Gammaproteobacteria bacterium]